MRPSLLTSGIDYEASRKLLKSLAISFERLRVVNPTQHLGIRRRPCVWLAVAAKLDFTVDGAGKRRATASLNPSGITGDLSRATRTQVHSLSSKSHSM